MNRSDALRDAEANCLEEQERITIEIINPDNVDENGDLVILYAVNDNADLVAKIEDTAIHNAGEVVTFKKCKFVAKPISISGETLPIYSIQVQNIGESLLKHFRAAARSGAETQVNFRYYLPSRALNDPEADTEFLIADSISHSTAGSMITVNFRVLSFLNNKIPKSLHASN